MKIFRNTCLSIRDLKLVVLLFNILYYSGGAPNNLQDFLLKHFYHKCQKLDKWFEIFKSFSCYVPYLHHHFKNTLIGILGHQNKPVKGHNKDCSKSFIIITTSLNFSPIHDTEYKKYIVPEGRASCNFISSYNFKSVKVCILCSRLNI